ncbi:hypothetical protein GCM10009555_053960 [Acrocarpospora macrocephala]|uniref:HTH cro/C1-type domain-containing protein n=1 Tax=Acrocarpospora macrocephala TaxID=150177 RepID=A0A5M3WUX3_9ACTN|nr:helix-turn-helix transcriptional regulator [Acrocarpospora macrocephala]GES11091.1 hypothetical protein Amac_046880 [Acrocarpospora macrocephala]
MSRQLEPFAPGVLSLHRTGAGMSVSRLATAVGVSKRQIIYYEQGYHSPSPARLKKLAEVLGTTPQTLAGVPRGEESLTDLRRFAGLDRAQAARLLSRILPGVTVWKLQAAESGKVVQAWVDSQVLKQVIKELAGLYGVPVGTVRRSWLRIFPQQVHLLREEQADATGAKQPVLPTEKALQDWKGLNDRQQAYLIACYREDQEAEAHAKQEHAAGRDPGGAAVWRKLPFTIKADPALTGYTAIQIRLREQGQHDPGAGASLAALARRGLIELSEDEAEVFPLGFVTRVLVELTRSGRACARAGLGESGPIRAPRQLLSEWLWQNLVKVATAGAEGLAEAGLWGKSRFFLGVGFRPSGIPSRGYVNAISVREEVAGDSYVKEYRWHLTEAGRQHLKQYLDTYRTLYPHVDVTELTTDP